MNRSKQAGFGHIIALCAVLLVIGVGYIGYRVVADRQAKPAAVASSDAQPSTAKPTVQATVPTTLKSTADISKAAADLDNANLQSDLNPDALSADLNALL